ncbi:hypothetical protein RND81_10G155900 [Saponaria officinalis]|uniref:Endonuclease/exonuclease/phosphatase domain-containing protein n=1 Tax=Saponaria officinalis TaxID=3572 RepID=A0AAW1I246_SAPOF
MRGLVWNCRGLNSSLAPTSSKLRSMLSMFSYDFIFLMETKCNVVKTAPFCRPFGYVNYDGVDAIGSSGGLFLAWKKEINIVCMYKCCNFIICRVHECKDLFWYLCLVYRAPKASYRERVWDELGVWLESFDKPALLIGDFNQVDFTWDKLSTNTGKIKGADTFIDWCREQNLSEIPYKGLKYTWCNNMSGHKRVYERLDKAYVTENWFSIHHDTGIKHFPIQLSDHAPIEVDTNLVRDKRSRPYKLEAWNFEYEECLTLIKHQRSINFKGSANFTLMRKLGNVRKALKTWSLDKKQE